MQKILVVEDSSMVAKIILHLAKQELEFEIVLAMTFAEARAKFDESEGGFFAAIVDLNLPDAPNGEVVDYTLQKNLPTIVLTGSLDEKRRETLLAKGIVDYVTKEGKYSYLYALRLINRLSANMAIKVLVVEDSSTMRNVICNMLKRHLFKVVSAVDGIDAIKVFLANPDVKLLITDYNMPNMDGFELVKKIRCKYEKFDLIIIGLSAESETSLSAKFIKTGANDFLTKPFNPEEFYCRINHNIESLELIEKIRDVSNRDYLTGLYSRRYFFQKGQILWQQAKDSDELSSIAILSIDNFKSINEQYGNLFADSVLKKISDILNKVLFRFLVARSSGKSFYILLQGLDEKKLKILINKICAIVSRETFAFEDKLVFVTCSGGISHSLTDRLIDQVTIAEDLVTAAKAAGKNIVFSEHLEASDGYGAT